MPKRPTEIQQIVVPPVFVAGLNKLLNRVVKEQTPQPLLEFGRMNLGKIDDDSRLTCLAAFWIFDCNEIIDNLNLVIADLRELPTWHPVWPGESTTRFYLLVRTYFYEFYRFRELFGRLTKRLKHLGYLDRAELVEYREAFHNAYRETIEIRNLLVHDIPTWSGQEHLDLSLLDAERLRGNGLADLQTGQQITVEGVLSGLCERYANALRDEGLRMTRTLDSLALGLASLDEARRGTVDSG